MPKPAGVSFNRYAAIAGQVLRKSLKEPARVAAANLDNFELKYQKWENGAPSESKPLEVPLKKD